MSNEIPSTPVADILDSKVNKHFAGRVVRKDLVRRVKVGANVPAFVLEFLLGKYCASSDPMAIAMGLQVVNDTLRDNYIRPDESTKAQSKVKELGRFTFIDKVKVRLVDSEYWAEVVNFGHTFVHIPDHYVRQFERLLTGGIWAQVDMVFQYDEETKGKYPFWIDKLTPIQLASFDMDEYRSLRKEFTTDEWRDLIVRSMGYDTERLDKRTKMFYCLRLVQLCERNFNYVDLGPPSTGKSYAVQDLSPYAALLTGPTTVANMFGHMSGRRKGMVEIWDAVCFDEVADLEKMPKEVITTMKTYCESGKFQRGPEESAGYSSIGFLGNTRQPVDVMVQSSHLFAAMPGVIRDDIAFLDRIHYYLPGWEMPVMRNELFTNRYGLVIDYLAEALRELRKANFSETLDQYFSLGSHLNTRDRKAVRRTASGMIKVLHPHGEVAKDDLAEILAFAIEGRRRVKEQLKKMGSFDYYQTAFSYIENESGEEHFVGVPEQGGRDLISADPLPPGCVYAASVDAAGTVGLFRIEVTLSGGTGKLRLAGGVSGSMKESFARAFSYLSANKTTLGVARDVDLSDFHVECIDLLGNRVDGEFGVAFLVACYSILRRASTMAGLLAMGDLSIQGNIKTVRSLAEPLRLAKDNGARKVLVPTENKRQFLEVDSEIIEHVDPIFYGDLRSALMKALEI
jgi:ATP-dependent Lon protease